MYSIKALDRCGIFQHGLLTLDQLREAGASRQERRTLTGKGLLVPVGTGVYRACGSPRSWEQALHTACLDAGPEALATHRAAALLWGLVDPPQPIEITVPYAQRASPATAIRHRSQALRPGDRAVRRRIPVTTPARTLLDLGAVAPALVAQAVERALHLRLTTTAGLWQLLAELAGPGRRGVRPLRTALEQRALGDAAPASLLEPVFAEIAVAAGVEVEYQHAVVLDGHRSVLDFAVPRILLAVEVDGLQAHGTREALDSDLERQNRLVRHGWLVLRYTYTHLRRRRRAIRKELLDVVRQRQALPLPAL